MSYPYEVPQHHHRKQRDPNAPKKPRSAYIFFTMQQRPSIQTTHPGASLGQTTQILAAQWNAMTPQQKAPYEAQAQADKGRYEAEMARYHPTAVTGTGYY